MELNGLEDASMPIILSVLSAIMFEKCLQIEMNAFHYNASVKEIEKIITVVFSGFIFNLQFVFLQRLNFTGKKCRLGLMFKNKKIDRKIYGSYSVQRIGEEVTIRHLEM